MTTRRFRSAGIGPPIDCGLLSFTPSGWPVFRHRTDTTANGWPVTDPAKIAALRADRRNPVDDPIHAVDQFDETGTRPVVDALTPTGPAVVANADSIAVMIAAAALVRAKRDHPELFTRRRHPTGTETDSYT